ncbi:hypothetical protein CTHBC1_2715 [Acetivibrio thermocellus BC1]|nr:hypothetical protein CTHBC1_2715 [Acetivibrio thermocellus BC1]
MFCKDCGSQLPDRYKFCEVCGVETDSLISENGINNLYLSSVKRKKKLKIKAIIFTALIIAIGISVFFVNYTKKRSGLYNNIAWGTSREKIGKMLRDDLIKGEGFSSDLSIIEDYDGMKGVRAYVSYMFEDDRLCGISVTLSNQNSSYTDSMIIEKCTDKFNKLYGKKDEDTTRSIWNAGKSDIELDHLMDGVIIIRYTDTTEFKKQRDITY